VELEAFPEPEALSLPQSTYPVQSLAREVTAGITNPYDRIQALIGYVEKTCRYTLQEETTPQGEDAAVYYLTQSRRGACDLSATALAVMARSVGIPARVAVGYLGDERLPTGDGWQIRQAHLHMWIEAFFPGYGWVAFNPSPPMVDAHDTPWQVILDRVHGLFSKIGGGGLDALLLVAVIFLTATMAGYGAWVQFRTRWGARQAEERELRADPAAAVAVLYRRAIRALDRHGWQREPWMTPREYYDWLGGEAAKLDPPHTAAEALSAVSVLTRLFEEAQYAGHAGPEQVQEAEAALARIARLLPRRPRPKETPPSWKAMWRVLATRGAA
jgi:hypothetical protein